MRSIGSIGEGEKMLGDTPASDGQEEKILVSVRLRPLNEKELLRNEISDWECINSNTIIFKNNLTERAMFPTAYTFDRVFGRDCSTKQVYEEGAKEVALSVVYGINSTIFAYGQTSSGKTYTMSGVTEYSVSDIYNYIEMHKDREFVLKFSAIEIYNEAVKDLLSLDTVPRRLLDDPERGTIIEKLTEETLRDMSHLQELLSLCEAQRKIGETSLNEASSRSHQILRLTVESSAREYLGSDNQSTLAAAVNFVDLAGSERASQTMSVGAKLKEGSHINRSLLTLGTVIRKLSKGRNGHIPYRDSKLTRILQNSLGGNARTAIICTMSPARCHVEQSRNTLLFASCAKEVTINAQVNVVMSDKVLVKQLQRELARLESELKNLGSNFIPSDPAALLKEKEFLIEQMDEEIRELRKQRDLAQSRVENLLLSVGEDRDSKFDECSVLSSSDLVDPLHPDFEGFNTLKASDRYKMDNEIRELTKHRDLAQSRAENLLMSVEEDRDSKFDECSVLSSSDLVDSLHSYFEGLNTLKASDRYKMDKEIRELTKQRDLAQSRVENLLLLVGEDRDSKLDERSIQSSSDLVDSPHPVFEGLNRVKASDRHKVHNSLKVNPRLSTSDDLEDNFLLDGSTPKFVVLSPFHGWEEITQIADADSEDICKEVRCIEMDESRCEHKEGDLCVPNPSEQGQIAIAMAANYISCPRKENRETSKFSTDQTLDTLKYEAQELQKAINCLGTAYPSDQSPCSSRMSSSRSVKLTRSRSSQAILMTLPSYVWSEKVEHDENIQPTVLDKDFSERLERIKRILRERKRDEKRKKLGREDSQISSRSAGIKTRIFKELDEDDNTSLLNFVTGRKEKVKPHSKIRSCINFELDKAHKRNGPRETFQPANMDKPQLLQSVSHWTSEFEKQRREIIELWGECNVPLVHRTYFFILFKGEPSDAVYMEIELRRLSSIRVAFSRGNNTRTNDGSLTRTSSMKFLNREREQLCKQVRKKFSSKERERLYQKWGIDLKTKQRGLQMVHRLWTETRDMNHIKESAALVAKMVGFVEPVGAAGEMFGLRFLPQPLTQRSFNWKHTTSSLF